MMRTALAILICAAFFECAVAPRRASLRAATEPQNSSALPPAASVVHTSTFVSLEPVPREREFQAAVVVNIARGFHMNSHKPSDAYLIPTTLTPDLPAGFELLDTIYPPGQLEKFSFSPNRQLDVYSGSVTLRMRFSAKANAPVGPVAIPLTLRYQACNDAACLPPVKVPVTVKFEVARAGAKARAVHPEIFSALMPAR